MHVEIYQFSVAVCQDGSQPVNCSVNPCTLATCDSHPNATCMPNYCGGCNADFYGDDGGKVDCDGKENI